MLVLKQWLKRGPSDSDGVEIILHTAHQEAEDGHGHQDAVLDFYFFGVVPSILATLAIWHLVWQVLMWHQQNGEPDDDHGDHVENEEILETFGNVQTVLLGVGAEPQEVPVGQQEHGQVHNDVNKARHVSVHQLPYALNNGHYGAEDVEHAHYSHSFVDLNTKAACLRLLILRIQHFF